MAESIEFVLLNLVQKVKAGKMSPRNFVGTIKQKINFVPYNLTKSLGKAMDSASWSTRNDKGKADLLIEEISDFYGWDEEDVILTENMKTNKSAKSLSKIKFHTKSGIKIVPFSKFRAINESTELLDGPVEWPTDEESQKAISILNKWLYELLNNGGDNAEYELETGRLWYFSKSFKDYINKALGIIKELGIESAMPTIIKMAKMNGTEAISVGNDATNAYAEMDNISNWDDLQIGSLDFIDHEKTTPSRSIDDDQFDESINESYGDVLAELVVAFNKAADAMKGSSVGDPREIWVDLGEKLGVITEKEADKLKYSE